MKIGVYVGLIMLSARLAIATITNGSFEDGLAGWTTLVSPQDLSLTSVNSVGSSLGLYAAVEGQRFAELSALRGGSITLSQPVRLRAGETLSGYAAAAAVFGGFPTYVDAELVLSAAGLPPMTVWEATLIPHDFGATGTPWTRWAFVAPDEGEFLLSLRMTTGHSGGRAYLDAVGVPESGTTSVLLGFALLGLFGIPTSRELRR